MSALSTDAGEKRWSIRCEKHFRFTPAIRRLYKYLHQRLDPQHFEIIPFETIEYEFGRWAQGKEDMIDTAITKLLRENATSRTMVLRGLKASSTALHIPLFLEHANDLVGFHTFQAAFEHVLQTHGHTGYSSKFVSLPIVRFRSSFSHTYLPSIEQWEECDFGELRLNEWKVCSGDTVLFRMPCSQFLCHRGNYETKFVPDENRPDIVDRRIRDGYGVELDLWFRDERYWLGHDEPQYQISFEWLLYNLSKKYIHCKDGPTFEHMLLRCGREGYSPNLFYHTNEDYALTTRGDVICHPGKALLEGSINMMPEMGSAKPKEEREKAFAVCSDAIRNWNQ